MFHKVQRFFPLRFFFLVLIFFFFYPIVFFNKGNREVGGGKGRPAERDRDAPEGEGQAGVHARGPQPCVQTSSRGASPELPT